MRVTPKTEKQIQEKALLQPDIYDFEITDAKQSISSKGNDMIVLTVRLFNKQGDPHGLVTDYLLDSIPKKLRHAAEVCGLIDDYQNGELNHFSFKGKFGRAKVGIKTDKNGVYPDKNTISDYLKPETIGEDRPASSAPKRQMATADLDDEIPF